MSLNSSVLVLPYSHEEDTYNDKNYKDDVDASVKQERMNKIMEAQEAISLSINEGKIGIL